MLSAKRVLTDTATVPRNPILIVVRIKIIIIGQGITVVDAPKITA